MAYQLQEINRRIKTDVTEFLEECDQAYAQRVSLAADRILSNLDKSPVVLLSGPSGSGKTTTAMKIAEELQRRGVNTHAVAMDNYFKSLNRKTAPRTPEGDIDYESPQCLDMELLDQHFAALSRGEEIIIPKFEFARQMRNDARGTPLKLGKNEIAIFEGIHALNPELTGLVKGDDIYRIYAGLREEYCIDGRRVINTQDIRLCRRTLRDAATRGQDPDHVGPCAGRRDPVYQGLQDHGRLSAGHLFYLRAGPDLQPAGRGAPPVHAGRPQCRVVG